MIRGGVGVSVLALGVACGGISKDRFCDEFAQAACATAKKCCPEVTFSEDSCRSSASGSCSFVFILPVNGGKARYDEARAGDCVRELNALAPACPGKDGTSDLYASAPACTKVVVGLAREGESCGDDAVFSCAEGLSCHIQQNDTAVCVRPAGAGESCADKSCGEQLYCDVGGGETCMPEVAVGAACASGSQCVEEAYCATGTCTRRKGTGESCAGSSECASQECTAGRCEAAPNPYCSFASGGGG